MIAIAFSRNTKLIEATKSSLLALIMGASEAIAVPPQIAVPDTSKRVRFLGNLINLAKQKIENQYLRALVFQLYEKQKK